MLAFIASLFSVTPSHAVQARLLYKLTAPDAQPGARFGDSLSIVDGDILVSAPAHVAFPFDALGKAYLFDGQNGQPKFDFINPMPIDQDRYAAAITGGDGKIFISQVGQQESVYVYSTATGAQLGRINNPENESIGFANSLAYGAGDLLVGAPSYSGIPFVANAIGQAYLYNTATNTASYTLPNPEPNDGDLFSFGKSVSITDKFVSIGALSDDLPGSPIFTNPGRIWLFDRHTASLVKSIENPNPESIYFDWFGFSLDANESVVLTGARKDGTSGVDGSGTAYVFNAQNGALLHTLFSPQPEDNGEFGRSVALTPSGDILVGAWGTSVSGIVNAGHAYLFDGQTGQLLLDIPNPEPTESAQFGWSVEAYDNRLVIGARFADSNGMPATGAVYVYEIVPEPSVYWGLTFMSILFFWFFKKTNNRICFFGLCKLQITLRPLTHFKGVKHEYFSSFATGWHSPRYTF
ncbi:MAG: hypothetical protein SFX18_16470 [Pirellulales bacterium]|nr:hypothetical protein [Pirellulales bacterium]